LREGCRGDGERDVWCEVDGLSPRQCRSSPAIGFASSMTSGHHTLSTPMHADAYRQQTHRLLSRVLTLALFPRSSSASSSPVSPAELGLPSLLTCAASDGTPGPLGRDKGSAWLIALNTLETASRVSADIASHSEAGITGGLSAMVKIAWWMRGNDGWASTRARRRVIVQ